MPTLFSSLGREPRPFAHKPMISLLIIGLLAAFWPLGPWFVQRLHDNQDEPLGLLALLTALGFLFARRHEWRLSPGGCWIASGILLTEMLFHRQLPSLLEAGLLVLAIGSMLDLPKQAPGIAALLVLSLPIVASAQFYLGYPLRIGAAWFSASTMNLIGCDVTRIGTDLLWHGAQVGVDPPCSGVRMLWVACFVAAALAARSRLALPRFVILMLSAVVMVVLANALRAMLLFPSEAGVMLPFTGLHEGVGIVVMIASFWCLTRLHDWLAAKTTPPMQHQPESSMSARFAATAVIGIGVATAILHCFQPDREVHSQTISTVTWPTQFEGITLEKLPLSHYEEIFAQTFPGHLARFRWGQGEVIMRQVERASRTVHSSRECFQAKDFEVKSLTLWHDRDNQVWSRFAATRDGSTMIVRERITDAAGHTWTDVGAWYWSALFHPETGPSTFVSVIEPQSPTLASLNADGTIR